jgi:hypothetical protein
VQQKTFFCLCFQALSSRLCIGMGNGAVRKEKRFLKPLNWFETLKLVSICWLMEVDGIFAKINGIGVIMLKK